MSGDGVPMGKPLRTRFCNKTSNPNWDQELILYVPLNSPLTLAERRSMHFVGLYDLLCLYLCSCASLVRLLSLSYHIPPFSMRFTLYLSPSMASMTECSEVGTKRHFALLDPV